MTATLKIGDRVRRSRRAYSTLEKPPRVWFEEEGVIIDVRVSRLFKLTSATVRWPKITTEVALDRLEIAPATGRGA